jgi:HK97 family phage major capsid protein
MTETTINITVGETTSASSMQGTHYYESTASTDACDAPKSPAPQPQAVDEIKTSAESPAANPVKGEVLSVETGVIAFGDTVTAIKSSDGLTGMVSAIGIRYSNRNDTDLQGEYFTPETFFGHTKGNMAMATLNHRVPMLTEDTTPEQEAVLAKYARRHFKFPVTTKEEEEVGIIAQHILDLSDVYERMIFEQAAKSKLRWSSGSAGHMVERTKDGKITQWPILEWAYTPKPAEPKLPAILPLKTYSKQLAEEHPELRGFVPQDGEDSSAIPTAGGDADADDINQQHFDSADEPHDTKNTEVMEMTEELHTQETLPDPINVLTVEQFEEAMKRIVERDATPVKNPGNVITDPVEKKERGSEPFKSIGEQLKAVQIHALTQGRTTDPRLLYLNKAYKATGLSEGVPSDGGFLVQTDFVTELMRRTYETGILASRVDRYQASPNANGATINYVNETSRATGSRWGGIQGYWLAEAGTKTASKPEFGQMELKLKKLIGLCYATDELLADANLLGAVITQGFAEEFGWLVDDAIYNGTGAGQPLGVMNSGSLVTVTPEVGQAADTVVAENVMKMWSRMWGRSRLNAAWFINQDIEPQLYQLSLPVGTGGQAVYMPPNGLADSPYATLFGRPVIPVEQAATLGDTGDILLADFSQYVLLEKGGIESASSIHVQFTTDETAYRFVLRLDGQPKWVSALTPASGSANTLSPFVVLDDRA